MFDFIFNAALWTLALYGLIEIIRTIYYISTYAKIENKGVCLVLALKNQEKQVEALSRSVLFRYLYGREEYINRIIIADVNSEDNTMQILEKLEQDYDCIQVMKWEECKKVIENMK